MFCWNSGDACVVLSLMSADKPQNPALGQQFVNKWNERRPNVCAHAHTAFILWANYSKWCVCRLWLLYSPNYNLTKVMLSIKTGAAYFHNHSEPHSNTHTFFECADMFTRLCRVVMSWPTSVRRWRQVAVQLADLCLLRPDLVTFLRLQMLKPAFDTMAMEFGCLRISMSRSGLNASIILPFIKVVDLAVCHCVLSQPRTITLHNLVHSCGQQNNNNAAKSVPSTHNPFHYLIFFLVFLKAEKSMSIPVLWWKLSWKPPR